MGAIILHHKQDRIPHSHSRRIESESQAVCRMEWKTDKIRVQLYRAREEMLSNGGIQQLLVHVEVPAGQTFSTAANVRAPPEQKNDRSPDHLSHFPAIPLPVLCPRHHPPPKHVPLRVRRLRHRLLRPHRRHARLAARQLHRARERPPRERPSRVLQECRVVDARDPRVQRERERRELEHSVPRPTVHRGDVRLPAPAHERGRHAARADRDARKCRAGREREPRLNDEDEGREQEGERERGQGEDLEALECGRERALIDEGRAFGCVCRWGRKGRFGREGGG